MLKKPNTKRSKTVTETDPDMESDRIGLAEVSGSQESSDDSGDSTTLIEATSQIDSGYHSNSSTPTSTGQEFSFEVIDIF